MPFQIRTAPFAALAIGLALLGVSAVADEETPDNAPALAANPRPAAIDPGQWDGLSPEAKKQLRILRAPSAKPTPELQAIHETVKPEATLASIARGLAIEEALDTLGPEGALHSELNPAIFREILKVYLAESPDPIYHLVTLANSDADAELGDLDLGDALLKLHRGITSLEAVTGCHACESLPKTDLDRNFYLYTRFQKVETTADLAKRILFDALKNPALLDAWIQELTLKYSPKELGLLQEFLAEMANAHKTGEKESDSIVAAKNFWKANFADANVGNITKLSTKLSAAVKSMRGAAYFGDPDPNILADSNSWQSLIILDLPAPEDRRDFVDAFRKRLRDSQTILGSGARQPFSVTELYTQMTDEAEPDEIEEWATALSRCTFVEWEYRSCPELNLLLSALKKHPEHSSLVMRKLQEFMNVASRTNREGFNLPAREAAISAKYLSDLQNFGFLLEGIGKFPFEASQLTERQKWDFWQIFADGYNNGHKALKYFLAKIPGFILTHEEMRRFLVSDKLDLEPRAVWPEPLNDLIDVADKEDAALLRQLLISPETLDLKDPIKSRDSVIETVALRDYQLKTLKGFAGNPDFADGKPATEKEFYFSELVPAMETLAERPQELEERTRIRLFFALFKAKGTGFRLKGPTLRFIDQMESQVTNWGEVDGFWFLYIKNWLQSDQ